MKILKNEKDEPMLIAKTSTALISQFDQNQSGFFEEVSFSELPKKVKTAFTDGRLGGCGLAYDRYFRSNTHGESLGKCFVKVADPLRFSLKNDLNAEKLKDLSLKEGLDMIKSTLDRDVSFFIGVIHQEPNTDLRCSIRVKLIQDDYFAHDHIFKKYKKDVFELFSCIGPMYYSFDSDCINADKLTAMKKTKDYNLDEIENIAKKGRWE